MRNALKSLALAAAATLVAGTVMAQTTMTYNGAPFVINDVSTQSGTITVPAGDWGGRDTVRDVNVSISITHTWDSDLTVSLSGPDGTVVGLWAGVGGSSDNFNVTIDDEASTNMNGTVGTFRPQSYPQEAMCELDAKAPAGTYTLTVADTVGGDVGAVNSWSITIEGDSGHFKNDCGAGSEKRNRGLHSWANNGRGNGDDLPPPGQR